MINNLSILKKISFVVVMMGFVALAIAGAGGLGLLSLGSSLQNTGAREEVAREAMDLRIDIIAISRMTYQLAQEPDKAADFAKETEKRAAEMLARLPKIASTADANEQKQLQDIRTTLADYFDTIRGMVRIAGTDQGKDPVVMRKALDKALDGQKTVTAAVKVYSNYSAKTLSAARAEAIDKARTTMIVLMATAGICLAIGMTISTILARRGIAMPLRRLTATMSRLAAGDLNETIAGTDRGDEIGEMARTLDIFRANRQHMLELEAQEAALQKQSSDLQSSISTIVSAAAKGDFTQRISKTYEDADLQRFAESVNTLVDSVDRGIAEVRRVIAALAVSDLSQNMMGTFEGAFAELQTNVNHTMQTLRQTMQAIRNASGVITGNSGELSSAANQLARRTEQQAASLEETAAALEEITTTVRTSTGQAREASSLVEKTMNSAGKSGEIVKNAIDAMGKIEQSSEKIGQIISVIDEIAFQTNLLALNAGVEAARAGEAGRGFAVVAQEVRELAQRSANAAKDIKSLINTSGDHVKSGVSLVLSTGDALNEIVKLVNDVNGHVVGIAKASEEQSTALAEINTAVNQMDQMTQQNAAMVEETTAASQVLAQEAQHLQVQLDQFRLENGEGQKNLRQRAA